MVLFGDFPSFLVQLPEGYAPSVRVPPAFLGAKSKLAKAPPCAPMTSRAVRISVVRSDPQELGETNRC
jgi:hypothetical protein